MNANATAETRSAVLTLRLLPSEAQQVRDAIQQDGIPVSAWLRAVVLDHVISKKGSSDGS